VNALILLALEVLHQSQDNSMACGMVLYLVEVACIVAR
jgi:hypothetical protein